MNILVFNWQDWTNPFGGGAETHLYEIFRRIAAQGHSVTLFCCAYEGAAAEETLDGIRIIRRGSRSLFNIYVPYWYYTYFRHQKFDIVIDDVNKIPFYTPLFIKEPLLALSHHFFGKSIFREADPISASYVYSAEKLVDVVYKKTPWVVVSKSTLDEFARRGFDISNFSIITNAITQEDFPMKVSDKAAFPMITYFGRVKQYKSPDHLVRAFALVVKKHPTAELHFMGAGDFIEALQNLCEELAIANSVHFHGRVSNQTKVEVLSQSWCAVNTSMKEGWGITNIEANACGTLVVSADSPGLRDSVHNGVSGMLYPYGDVEKLAELLQMVIENSDTRNQLSEGAVEWATTFSWDSSASSMISRCSEIIESRRNCR